MTGKQIKVVVIAAVGLLLLAIIGATAWLAVDALRATHVRDIVIALVGVTMIMSNILVVLLLAILSLRVTSLFGFMQDQLKPLFVRAAATVERVQYTTNLVTDQIAQPAIRVGGVMAGLRRGFDQFKKIRQ